MSSFSSSRYLLAFSVLNLCFNALVAEHNISFGFKNFCQDSNFAQLVALYGDAKVAKDGISIQISGSGQLIYKKPINLVEGKPLKMVSFSVHFVFSMSSENGNGLALFIVPNFGFPFRYFYSGPMGMSRERKMKFLAVEFDTLKDQKYSDLNSNHIRIYVNSFVSVEVSNVSSVNLDLNSGEKLQSWIDYEASAKRLEVRLSKMGGKKSIDPLLSYPIDLSKMWKGKDVILGLSSSSRNSSQKCNIYSWNFTSRTMPRWVHSDPMDPEEFLEKGENKKVSKKSYCASRILAALIFGTGCGTLGAFILLFVWNFFVSRRPVMPEELAVQPKEMKYKEFSATVDKSVEDGKK